MKYTLEILHSEECFAHELDQRHGNPSREVLWYLQQMKCHNLLVPVLEGFNKNRKSWLQGFCEIYSVRHFEQVTSRRY